MHIGQLLIFTLMLFISCSNSSEKTAESQNQVEESVVADSTTEKLPAMLDLGSTTCIPCKKMAPILDSLKIVYAGKAQINFIDIRKDKDAVRQYGITMIPTQIFLDNDGREVYRHVGFFPADSITIHLAALGVSP